MTSSPNIILSDDSINPSSADEDELLTFKELPRNTVVVNDEPFLAQAKNNASWAGMPLKRKTTDSDAPITAAKKRKKLDKRYVGRQDCVCGSCDKFRAQFKPIAQRCCGKKKEKGEECLTLHKELWDLLTPFKLETMHNWAHNEQMDIEEEKLDHNNRNYRRTAYRIVFTHIHGRTKIPYKRIPLPMCVVGRIRELFPSATYGNFEPAEDLQQLMDEEDDSEIDI